MNLFSSQTFVSVAEWACYILQTHKVFKMCTPLAWSHLDLSQQLRLQVPKLNFDVAVVSKFETKASRHIIIAFWYGAHMVSKFTVLSFIFFVKDFHCYKIRERLRKLTGKRCCPTFCEVVAMQGVVCGLLSKSTLLELILKPITCKFGSWQTGQLEPLNCAWLCGVCISVALRTNNS
jgi:hypothetical protein